MSLKRTGALAAFFLAPVFWAVGQSSGTADTETSVEESYLQESVDVMIIREQSRSGSREMKLAALEYIGNAIEEGKAGEDIQGALEYMAMEGILNKTHENGRLTNNFPDVRTKAAAYLGDLGTVEAKDTLIKMTLVETEPMVLTEAIKSLGKIGMNEENETTNTISWIVARFDTLNPDNLLALSALDTFEIIAEKNGGLRDAATLRAIMRIGEGPYIKAVQDRAKQLLATLRKYSAQNR